MLKEKVIQPSHSPWNSPIWIVPKKSDASGKRKTRMVIDFRKVNSETKSDRFPIPVIETLLDHVGYSKYFTTLDLHSGFHQIPMDKNDIEKTAFSTSSGHYEFLRMPFGLKNAPASFQRMMILALGDLVNKICLVYIDDVVIFGRTLEEHLHNIKLVFEKLRKANLKIQLDKSEFLKEQTKYLGYIITPDGIKTDPSKVEAIRNLNIPKTKKEIKQFLGTIRCYRKFIPNFAKLTKPFTLCLKNGQKIDIYNESYRKSFNESKEI